MDAFEIDTVKVEKAIAMKKYRRIRQIRNLFEVCLALILLSWFTSWLPIVVKISGNYLRLLGVVLVSPLFVFFVGNAIIIILVAKSGQFSGGTSGNLYDEFVKNSENRPKYLADEYASVSEEIVFQDKAVCVENLKAETVTSTKALTYRRSQSENLRPEKEEICRKSIQELRKSETFSWNDGKSGRLLTENSNSEAVMSNEEFRRKIEAFIAKQLRFQREESLSIVLRNQD